MNEKAHETIERTGDFPTDPSGLPRAVAPRVVELADGGTTELHIGPVIKRVGDADVRMLAYSGSIPGPTLKIPEGATVTVHVRNEGDLDATVHWHGLRLENRYDGTTTRKRRYPSERPLPTRCTSRTPARTGTTLTSERTTARRWGCTGTSMSSRPTRSTGRPSTASCS